MLPLTKILRSSFIAIKTYRREMEERERRAKYRNDDYAAREDYGKDRQDYRRTEDRKAERKEDRTPSLSLSPSGRDAAVADR